MVLKGLKGKTLSSARWLQRQSHDYYVQQAKLHSFRSRAAFKLTQMHDKFSFLKHSILDLGASPGGWSQIAGQCVPNKVIAMDILPMQSLPGVRFVRGDFRLAADRKILVDTIRQLHGQEKLQVILSDMAPSLTGNTIRDQAAQWKLCRDAFRLVGSLLLPGGTFVVKVFVGGELKEYRSDLEKVFQSVSVMKPPASRRESSELYLIARRYQFT